MSRATSTSSAAPSPTLGYHGPLTPNRYEWELENERAKMLRRRFMWFTGTLIVLALISAACTIHPAFAASGAEQAGAILNLGGSLVHLVVLLLAFRYARKQVRRQNRLYALAFWLVVGLGLFSLLMARVVGEVSMRGEFSRGIEAGYAQAQREVVEEPTPAETARDVAAVATPALAAPLPPDVPALRERRIVINNGSTAVVTETEAGPPPQVMALVLQAFSLGIIWWSVFANHFFACLFLPWTVREAWRPAYWLLGGAAVIVSLDLLLGRGSVFFLAASLLLLPLAPLPGLAWCWWRHSRFKESFRWRFESSQLRQLHQELDGARKIHEASLPPPQPEGPLQFSYVYEPMQQIGGDLIFVHPRPPEDCLKGAVPASMPNRYTMVLLDVTGHGIAAALTVNRLVGELERLFAERPNLPVNEVMESLNRYAYLTIATHGVFVTGIVAAVECDRECNDVWTDPHRLTFTSAGHPTAFVRRADGRLEPLESDCTMLGVLPPEAFDARARVLELNPGDALITYTDGAAEARNVDGDMIGIDGVRRLLAEVADGPSDLSMATQPPRGSTADAFNWPGRIIRRVAAHRNGPPEDDTLIAIIYRPPAPVMASLQQNDADEAADELVGAA